MALSRESSVNPMFSVRDFNIDDKKIDYIFLTTHHFPAISHG
jgi:hypothetical protein